MVVNLNRAQPYLKSYRTHNLWLDHYMKKLRTPRIHAFHIGFFKRMANSNSGARVIACWWGFTFMAAGKFFLGFSNKAEEDKKPAEVYNKIMLIFQKNQYGYHTRRATLPSPMSSNYSRIRMRGITASRSASGSLPGSAPTTTNQTTYRSTRSCPRDRSILMKINITTGDASKSSSVNARS